MKPRPPISPGHAVRVAVRVARLCKLLKMHDGLVSLSPPNPSVVNVMIPLFVQIHGSEVDEHDTSGKLREFLRLRALARLEDFFTTCRTSMPYEDDDCGNAAD